MTRPFSHEHAAEHLSSTCANPMLPARRDLVRIGSRRWFLQMGTAGIAGLALPDLLRARASGATSAARGDKKAVILFWLSGGPSHIDTWDPKPNASIEIRGPYGTIPTSAPGIRVCEHLPLQAQIMDKLSIIRSVDCSSSNHTPITMQAGNSLARRTDDGKDGGGYPSLGSLAARYRGANAIGMPPFVGLAESWKADVWGAGELGGQFEPVRGLEVANKLTLPAGLNLARLQDRHQLRQGLDGLARAFDQNDVRARLNVYQQTAYDMVLSGHVREAFDIGRESDAARDAYGRGSVGEKALLARRLVEAGVTFVLVSGAWGYFDHHGDEVKWGGIEKGLTPLLPTIDRALYTLVSDLAQRGMLDSTLVLMMGEFGRSPVINANRGRDHWTNVMSMVMAGGGMPGGRAIGSTDSKGYGVQSGRVTPEDLAATVLRHLEVPLETEWTDMQGRPHRVVQNNGRPLQDLA